MASLNDKIIAYLTVNNISFTSGDYLTGQPEGQADQILYWNTEKLGDEPTTAQLDESYPIWEGQQIAAKNKTQAEQLLQATDWTATMDVGNPQYRNPYLGNQNEFLTYRAQLCNIALNPPMTIVQWPTKPEEQWSTQ